MSIQPELSREYVFVPFSQMNFDVGDLDTAQMAFLATPGVSPEEVDWITAIVVDDQSSLFSPQIGEAIAVLVGPDRGDAVTTEELAPDDYQVWIDVAVTGSDERVVRLAGVHTINVTGQ